MLHPFKNTTPRYPPSPVAPPTMRSPMMFMLAAHTLTNGPACLLTRTAKPCACKAQTGISQQLPCFSSMRGPNTPGTGCSSCCRGLQALTMLLPAWNRLAPHGTSSAAGRQLALGVLKQHPRSLHVSSLLGALGPGEPNTRRDADPRNHGSKCFFRGTLRHLVHRGRAL